MYFQPENITFIEETWHCIWFAASVHFPSFTVQICNSTVRNIPEVLRICRENSAISDKKDLRAQSTELVLYMCIFWGDVNYALVPLALFTCVENKTCYPQIQWTICYYNCMPLFLLFGHNTADSTALIHVNVAVESTWHLWLSRRLASPLPLGEIAISEPASWGHSKCHVLDHSCYWTLVLDSVGNQ